MTATVSHPAATIHLGAVRRPMTRGLAAITTMIGSLAALKLATNGVGAALKTAFDPAKAKQFMADAGELGAGRRDLVFHRARGFQHPLGRALFTQKVVPLGLALQRYGSTRVAGPVTFELTE